jgi:hypothetical protein
MRQTITITCRGVNGEATATFSLPAWLDLNPLQRVMKLHDTMRDVLQGQAFDIIREIRA